LKRALLYVLMGSTASWLGLRPLSGADIRSPYDMPRGAAPPGMRMCGPNAAYVLLRLYGIKVPLSALAAYQSPDPKGMSLAELREALCAHGLRAEVRQCPLAELCQRFSGPVIGSVEWVYSHEGHYLVILDATPTSLHILDSTSGKHWCTTPEKLGQIWRGYVIVPSDSSPLSGLLPVLPASICAVFWLLLAYLMTRRTRAMPLNRRRTSGSKEYSHAGIA
jgi:hypothetical protein